MSEILNNYEKPLSAKQAAEYLDLSLNALYKLTHSRRIKYFKPAGKKIYFRKSDLDKFVFSS